MEGMLVDYGNFIWIYLPKYYMYIYVCDTFFLEIVCLELIQVNPLTQFYGTFNMTELAQSL